MGLAVIADRRQGPNPIDEGATDRMSSGNAEADYILGGGFPDNSINIVMGHPGSGKTIFAEQLIFHNAGDDRPILYFTTLSEPLAKVVRYLQGFSFFDETKVGTQVVYEDIGPQLAAEGAGALIPLLKDAILTLSPKVIVIQAGTNNIGKELRLTIRRGTREFDKYIVALGDIDIHRRDVAPEGCRAAVDVEHARERYVAQVGVLVDLHRAQRPATRDGVHVAGRVASHDQRARHDRRRVDGDVVDRRRLRERQRQGRRAALRHEVDREHAVVQVGRKLGEAAARNLFLRGHIVTAQEAADARLITRAVPTDELDAPNILNHYAATKLLGEQYTLLYHMAYDVPTACVPPATFSSARSIGVFRGEGTLVLDPGRRDGGKGRPRDFRRFTPPPAASPHSPQRPPIQQQQISTSLYQSGSHIFEASLP